MRINLKRSITIVLSSIIILVGLSTKNIAHAETTTDNQIKGVINLEAGKAYNYDLNGDGTSETIMYKYKEIQNESDNGASLEFYINDKLCLSKKSGGWCYDMQICDLDTSDNYLDLYFASRAESDCVTSSFFARYNGETLSEFTGLKEKKPKDFNYIRYSLDKINGDGTFTILVDTPIYSDAIGCYNCSIPYQLKENKISLISTNTYTLNKFSKEYKYKVKKSFKVYQNADSKKVVFQAKKDSKVTFDKLYVTKSGKAYFEIKNSKGKTGWIHSSLKNLFYELPLWG